MNPLMLQLFIGKREQFAPSRDNVANQPHAVIPVPVADWLPEG